MTSSDHGEIAGIQMIMRRLAATKIQSIGRSKKAKKRVQAQREAKERERQLRELAMNEQDAAALKIQGVARKCRIRPLVSLRFNLRIEY
jgi:hypothetical protein